MKNEFSLGQLWIRRPDRSSEWADFGIVISLEPLTLRFFNHDRDWVQELTGRSLPAFIESTEYLQQK